MTKIERVRKVCKWLIYKGYAENDKELAELTGYTKSSFSQILNEKVPVSEKFIENISDVDKDINKVWILNGEGNMFLNETNYQTNKKQNLIPLYNDVSTVGGTSLQANTSDVSSTTEYIDAGDWFPGATAAIRHYGDSMVEYPSGCILALKKVLNRDLLIWGRNYCIETAEFRITKKIARSSNENYIILYSTNTETYPDGTLIHSPIEIPKELITNMALVLGNVTKELSSGAVQIIQKN